MKKLFLTLVFTVMALCGFAQLDFDHRIFTKQYGTVSEGRSLWGDVCVVKEGFADFYVYVNSCHHCNDYDLNITIVDHGKAGWDEWHFVTKPTKKSFSVRFVDCRETADFVIRIDNPEMVPSWLKGIIKINP